jgi:DDE superfamily endonuclease
MQAAKQAILHLIRRDPYYFGHDRSRWTLQMLLDSCHEIGWLSQAHLSTLPGLHRLLDRLGIGWKMGRQHVHSPDPHYEAKVWDLARLIELSEASQASEGLIVLVYLDEVTTYRQPSLARAYEASGRGAVQPLAERSHQSDTPTRIIASLEHFSGQVVYLRASRIGVRQMVEFYQKLRQAYPDAECIYVVQDNWPVHVHPDVLVALQPQTTQWLRATPPNWPLVPSAAAVRKWGQLQLPIQAVPLPTYASWLNPIEKLWRFLKQEVLHLHRLADDLLALRAEIDRFLDQFAFGSAQLLRYVGLYDD